MDITIPGSTKVLHVTVSVGVAKGTGNLGALIKAADEAMLLAKSNGRNQIEYHA